MHKTTPPELVKISVFAHWRGMLYTARCDSGNGARCAAFGV